MRSKRYMAEDSFILGVDYDSIDSITVSGEKAFSLSKEQRSWKFVCGDTITDVPTEKVKSGVTRYIGGMYSQEVIAATDENKEKYGFSADSETVMVAACGKDDYYKIIMGNETENGVYIMLDGSDEIYRTTNDYFKIGANLYGYRASAMGANETRTNQLITKHFNSVVSNGYMKMMEILTKDNRTDYDFSNGDWLMEFAQKNGIDDVVGHNLIWELSGTKQYTLDENGNYIDRDSLLTFMKEYITKVMKHYEGDGDPSEYQPGVDYSDWHIDVWDVVNEAVVEGNENYRHGSGFYNILGKEYVNYAFQFADEVGYDDIKLRYNDFENYRSGKRDAVYILMKNLLDSGCRVDTLGIQSHLSVDVVPPLKGPKGVAYAKTADFTANSSGFITKYCDNPVAAFRFLDFMMSEEASIFARFGVEGTDWLPADENTKAIFGDLGFEARILPILPYGAVQNSHWFQLNPAFLSSSILDTMAWDGDELDGEYFKAKALKAYEGKGPKNTFVTQQMLLDIDDTPTYLGKVFKEKWGKALRIIFCV